MPFSSAVMVRSHWIPAVWSFRRQEQAVYPLNESGKGLLPCSIDDFGKAGLFASDELL
jgi:hypothetical protein